MLIVGAGGSNGIHPKFPIGIDLIQQIDAHLTTTLYEPIVEGQGPFISTLVNAIMCEWGMSIPETRKRVEQIKRKLWGYIQDWHHHTFHEDRIGISIDALVEKEFKSDMELVKTIKFSIAYLIKGAEHGICRARELGYTLPESWVKAIVEVPVERRPKILTFNYDRIIESEILRLTNNRTNDVKVHHVYGSIGTLEQVGFEVKNEERRLLRQHCEGIRLIYERARIPEEWVVNNFDRVLFVGFGFDDQNMKVLGIEDKMANAIGYAYGGIEPYKNVIARHGVNMKLADSAAHFLREYL
jgi:hypothetical protein